MFNLLKFGVFAHPLVTQHSDRTPEFSYAILYYHSDLKCFLLSISISSLIQELSAHVSAFLNIWVLTQLGSSDSGLGPSCSNPKSPLHVSCPEVQRQALYLSPWSGPIVLFQSCTCTTIALSRPDLSVTRRYSQVSHLAPGLLAVPVVLLFPMKLIPSSLHGSW